MNSIIAKASKENEEEEAQVNEAIKNGSEGHGKSGHLSDWHRRYFTLPLALFVIKGAKNRNDGRGNESRRKCCRA